MLTILTIDKWTRENIFMKTLNISVKRHFWWTLFLYSNPSANDFQTLKILGLNKLAEKRGKKLFAKWAGEICESMFNSDQVGKEREEKKPSKTHTKTNKLITLSILSGLIKKNERIQNDEFDIDSSPDILCSAKKKITSFLSKIPLLQVSFISRN